VTADPERLQQIINNLVANAVKFTPPGGLVHVCVTPTNGRVEVVVRDTGRGIGPDFLPHVFDRFRQEDATSTREHGGLGLGLSIARELAQLHGGSITADSAGVGQGAAFTLTLPRS
jgi:signal transduction histidine kinase